MTLCRQFLLLSAICLVVSPILTTTSHCKDLGEIKTNVFQSASASDPPNTQVRVHKTGNVHTTVTNCGMYGSHNDPGILDPETGEPAPSCEHPAGSDLDYLYIGSLWVGAIVGSDTLVSVGLDGWYYVNEMFPAAAPDGDFLKRSTLPGDPHYHPDAVSEADYIAEYFDTLTDPTYVPQHPEDGRPHIPLQLKIRQESYSWSDPAYEDFVIFKYVIHNVGGQHLEETYFGLYFDSDVLFTPGISGFIDDISGSLSALDPVSGRQILIGWTADNDGDPYFGSWNDQSPRGVFGVGLIQSPTFTQSGFNWWIPHPNPSLDWGPRRFDSGCEFPTGALGYPPRDVDKYCVMSEREVDYDQIWAAVDITAEGWLPPNPNIGEAMADGHDTRFLYSFGPVDVPPGDSVEFAFVLAIGDDLHNDPYNLGFNFDPQDPQLYYDNLDFSNLVQKVIDASELYRCELNTVWGDFDQTCLVEITDVVLIISYVLAPGDPPENLNQADVNGDCEVDAADAIYLLAYIFSYGPPPLPGCVG